MSHHVHVRFPSGLRLAADYRDPIVRTMRRYQRDLIVNGKWPPRKADVDALLAWYDKNREQSELCYRHQCRHDV